MRKTHHLLALTVVLGPTALLSAGCIDFVAEYYTPLTNPDLLDGGHGGEAGPPPSCVPSLNSTPVAATCGVFVSSTSGDDTTGKGTPAAPYKTIGKALAANASTIYACAGTAPYAEALSVGKAVALFGALDCTSWVYGAATKTQLTGPSDAVPLTLASTAGGTTVEDFAITAADATKAGGSSIAVLDDGAQVALTRCDLTAGKGADGAAGMMVSGSGQKGTDAPAPSPAGALDGCLSTSPNGVFGGSPGQSMCGTTDTSGGKGGDGTNLMVGGTATDAQPQPQPDAATGSDGKAGQPQTSTTACSVGDPGAAGLPGSMPGTGATGLGDLVSTGYQAPTATAGQSAGGNGYGGGGGGGAKQCTNTFAGPAGGGGGAGGCGGQPGGAGQSAGSSFAIVSVNASVTLDTVSLTAFNGGAGGAGGDGQPGGQGGNGGNAGSSSGDGSVAACNGGRGGQGGRGSSGGGGLGGHSAGIAFKGTAPVQKTVTIQHGSGGAGGIGGDMNMSVGVAGGSGISCTTLDFTSAASPVCGM